MSFGSLLVRWWRGLFTRFPFGRSGERAAAAYLRSHGYEILGRNVRLAVGEIDLVARIGETIVFVEVKTRRRDDDGHPSEFVDRAKQRKMTQVALAFLQRQGWTDRPARFDVIAVTWPDDEQSPTIEHFENAFEPAGISGMFS